MRKELTDRYLKSLKPPQSGRFEVSDTKRRGLRFRLTSRGKAVWMFEKRVKGGAKRKHTLGTWPALGLGEARMIALRIEAEAARGIDRVEINKARLHQEQAAAAAQLSLECVIDNYFELHLFRLRTGKERKRQLLQALAHKLQEPISSLEPNDIQHAIDEKVLAGRNVFANRIRSALLAFSKWAWLRGYVSEDIGVRISKPTREDARDRVPSLSEIQTIYKVAPELGTLWSPLIRLLILTGQRRSEIVGLRWEELDLPRRRMIKGGSETKNRKPHITHLSPPALAELQNRETKKRGYVFTTTGATPVSGISRAKYRLDGLLGPEFEPWRLHDLRTGMATALADAGEPESVVDRIQNHVASGSAPSAVARVYNQAQLLPQRAIALDRWAQMVTGATNGPC